MLLFNMPWLDNAFYILLAVLWLLGAAGLAGILYFLFRGARHSWRQLRSPYLLTRLGNAVVLVVLSIVAVPGVLFTWWVGYGIWQEHTSNQTLGDELRQPFPESPMRAPSPSEQPWVRSDSVNQPVPANISQLDHQPDTTQHNSPW